MIEKFYLNDYKGEARSGSILVASGATVRLPEADCKFVQISRWNATDDELFTTGGSSILDTDDEIYYGFDGILAHQLFVSQITDLIPVNNLRQIVVRVPAKVAGPITVHYTYFW